ncbi:hypothetical protein ACTOB_000295 [Actinoplanes oblitus]|uniref:Uncharacterized protein n=1 Tax=Actinoplanes oblitus TaxID=3040509 RepID=A0ABY8WIE0_9ACTN|nr:hypothetical protein [Actinoplanes oblitus]WIM96826.1 hypothetical protein ACTOB_000295 [Actinoplanes oblitus]
MAGTPAVEAPRDRLDPLLAAAEPLLSRVDEVLAAVGAPAGHDVWPELRRVRLLPGDAVRAVAALHPAAIAEPVAELRAQARACAATADALPLVTDWSGSAAEAYETARRRTAEQLNAGPDSLSRRMTATADLADALTDWMTRTRRDLAVTLADVLISAPALTLTAGPATGGPLDGLMDAQFLGSLSGPLAGSPSGLLADTPGGPFTGSPGDPFTGSPGGPLAGSRGGPLTGRPSGSLVGSPGGLFAGTPSGPSAGPASRTGLPSPEEARAAADIAAVLLAAVANSYDRAEDLLDAAVDLKTAQPV